MVNQDTSVKIRKLLQRVKSAILNILFPIECLGCGRENGWLCDGCANKIKYNLEDMCVVCKEFSQFSLTHRRCQKRTSLDGLIIACSFDDRLLRNIIYRFKYNFVKDLAQGLSQILINKILLAKQQGNSFLFKYDLIVVPVPIHTRRLRWRGFNQSELLARAIVDFFGYRFENGILQRRKYTRPQTKLKRKKRIKNIENVFIVDESKTDNFAKTNILLIDDVATTGSTINECARVLKANGAKNVWGIVLARGE